VLCQGGDFKGKPQSSRRFLPCGFNTFCDKKVLTLSFRRSLSYNRIVPEERNLTDLIKRSLPKDRLELLHLVAFQANAVQMPLYLVGGVVRDILLGRAVNDFDLVVEGNVAALAEYVLKKHGGRIMTHARFGTATWTLNADTYQRLNVPVLLPSDSPISFDLVSARSETYSQPGALPTVKFSTIDDDLRRRDFTINAMAIRLDGYHFGELYDPLNGQADLERGMIRVLHPKSFLDDPTRLFRALRYESRYGFRIAPETLVLMNDEARAVLSGLSGERLRHEFDLIFEETIPSAVLERLADMDLLKPVHPALTFANSQLPFLENPSPEFGEFAVPDILSFRQALGWTLWLMPILAYEIDLIAERLAFPALLTKSARSASALNQELSSLQKRRPSQWTFHLDEFPSLAVYAVYLVKSEQALHDYLVKWQHVKPKTTGDDLKARGLEPGPKYAEILRRLRAAWLDGEVKTEKEELSLLDAELGSL
jgi:tRNA nucleotidyltransferase (CCA-adding enzyme)